MPQRMSIRMTVTMAPSIPILGILLLEVVATGLIIQDQLAAHPYITWKHVHNHYPLVAQVVIMEPVLVHILMMFIDAIMDILSLQLQYGIGPVIIAAHPMKSRPIVPLPLVRIQEQDIIR